MLKDIDTICQKRGVYPHAFLSGHAHNYQRFTRTVQMGGGTYQVPFVICGDGGHNVNKLVQGKKGQAAQEPNYGVDVSYLEAKQPGVKAKGLVLEHYDDANFGYLRITVDSEKAQIAFHTAGTSALPQSRADVVTVELGTHRVVLHD